MYRSPGYNIEPTKLNTKIDNLGYSDMLKNLDNSFKYGFNYTLSGKGFAGKDLTQGNNFYIKSGLCDNVGSEDDCKGQQKYTYVRNIPIGKIPPFGLSFVESTGCNLPGATEMRGVLPGMIEDIYDINPVEMTLGLMGSGNLGSKICKKIKLPTGYDIYEQSKENKTWRFEEKCTAGHTNMLSTSDPPLNAAIKRQNRTIENAALPGAKQFEFFANDDVYLRNPRKHIIFKTPWSLFILILLCMVTALFFIFRL
jgi:hypothetical protein